MGWYDHRSGALGAPVFLIQSMKIARVNWHSSWNSRTPLELFSCEKGPFSDLSIRFFFAPVQGRRPPAPALSPFALVKWLNHRTRLLLIS